jgi:flap endonuclease-1
MGIQLGKLVHPKDVPLPSLKGRKLALDAYNMLYQFLATIRQPDGRVFTNPNGVVTSHLVGLLYRTSSLLENGILPVYVFDGKPSELKAATLRGRAMVKARAAEEWEKALAAGDLELAKKKAAATSRVTEEMVRDARELLEAMGVPWVQALSEGEAQASYMASKGEVWGVASEDYDTLLFGAPRLIKGLAALKSSARDPGVVRLLETAEVLRELAISQEELVLLGMLMGTDFNEGFDGIGPKKALKMVSEHAGYEATLVKVGGDPAALSPVRDLFATPPHADDYSIKWNKPDLPRLEQMLVTTQGFDASRVSKVIARLSRCPEPTPGAPRQIALDSFGGVQ